MPDFNARADHLASDRTTPFTHDAVINRDSAKPVSLIRRKVTATHARLSREIGRGCHFKLPTLDAEASLSFHLVDEVSFNWSDPIVLRAPSGSIEFAQGARLLRALSGMDISGESGADRERLNWLQAALIGRLAVTPFASAERLVFQALPSIPDEFSLRITLRSGSHAIVTQARASAATWLNILKDAEFTRERGSVSEYADLPSDVTVRVGRHTLPASALRTVAPGDVILPDCPGFTCGGTGRIRLGSWNAQVRFQAPSSIEIIEVENGMNADGHEFEGEDVETDGTVTEPAGALGESGGLDGLGDIPVTLDFELGRTRLLLGELRTIGPGAVLPFTGGSPASIAIVSCGRTLGRGEVVDVNGQLGIRVIAWGSAC